MTETWSDMESIGPGIYIYKNILTKDMNIINRLEKVLNGNMFDRFSWGTAQVGYESVMLDYRDCYDFKYKKEDIESDTSLGSKVLQDIWQEVYDRQKPAADHYCKEHKVGELKYWEAFNFVKYEVGQHFQEHSDHGWSYNCTVSLVNYINDDYEGGELYFPKWDITFSPDAGDLVVFPSNFMYSHKAMPVTSGTKYSIVTMLDYSKKYHGREMYRETGD